jgi:hypothetical protein
MSTHKTGAGSVLARTGLSLAVAATVIGGLATASHAVTTQQTLTLSSTTGPDTGTNTITLSLASTASPKFSSGFIGVQFQTVAAASFATGTCSTNPALAATSGTSQATVGTDQLRYLSTTKVSVVVPNLSAVTGKTGYWLVCAYNAAANSAAPATNLTSTTATVIGKGTYIAAAAPTVTGVVPSSGPATGGQTITVNGTGFPAAITANTPLTATLGGLPLTSITPISTTSFTAVTPARSTGSVALAVTTAGGPVTSAGAFTYVNGITVSPNTVPSGVSVDVDVQGTGFSLLTFANTDGTDVNHNDGHVYVTTGAYDATGFVAGSVDKPANFKSECVNVAVISDSELICTMDAARSIAVAANVYSYGSNAGAEAGVGNGALANGAYTLTVVNDGAAVAPTYATAVSSGATFTVADF